MKSQERMKFWSQHVEAQKSSHGSVANYCAREKIAVDSFYHWRRKLEKPQPSAVPAVVRPFTAVEIMNVPKSKFARSSSDRCHLPDPKWTAAFVSHLLREFTR